MNERGIGRNLPQFALLVGINALVGALVGQERTLVPLLAEETFGLASAVATAGFLVTFGSAKAAGNLVAGHLADRLGRRRVLRLGWMVGLPVPALLMWAPWWEAVLVANLLLGLNQAFTWSTTLMMKVDLAGDRQRGAAAGWNEAAGYVAVGVSAFVSGVLAARFGVRPEPFLLGLAIVLAGALLSLVVEETGTPGVAHRGLLPRVGGLARRPPLATAARTGLVTNANDAFAWALLPLLLLETGYSTGRIAAVAATYPVAWGFLQVGTGPLSDRLGRRPPIVAGMALQALGLAGFAAAGPFSLAVAAAATLGLGTALAYPALLAAAADCAPRERRASAVGFFRMWRDAGYVAGALAFGAVADLWGVRSAALVVAAVTAASALDASLHLPSARPGAPLVAEVTR